LSTAVVLAVIMAEAGSGGPFVKNGTFDEEKGLHRTTTGVTMSPELFEKVTLPATMRY